MMLHLKDAGFMGDQADIAEVLKNFSDIFFGGCLAAKSYNFTVKKFQNPENDDNPLYFIIPDHTIPNVWHDDLDKYQDIRYGTATKEGTPIISGVELHLKNRVGLYICLDPTCRVLGNHDIIGM